jgi:sigma-B regulation protein RsbU (phosphoserine phosphatase)
VQASQASFLSNGNDTAHPLPAGLKNILICPIQINGKIGAALGVLNKANGGFSSPDLKLMKAIAHQAGAQIENRLLYAKTLEQAKLETEMHMARNVQVNLLSKRLPQITGVQLAARSLPALEVGGDFFDFIPQPDGSVLFVIGDVSGKGMPSALLMAMIRTAVRSSAHAIENPLPEQVMSQVNEDLYDDFTDVEMFATAVIGRYMPESAQLIYANAGHAPMILRPQNGQARMFEADGPALGMLPMNLSQNQTIPFGPGDLLVIGTDGFSEARNPSGDMFGYERLLQLTDELAHLPADEITTIFFDRIAHFSGGRPQDDDQTLMIIKGAT